MQQYPCLRCHAGEPFASVRELLDHVGQVHQGCPPDPHEHHRHECGCATLSFPSGRRQWLRRCEQHQRH